MVSRLAKTGLLPYSNPDLMQWSAMMSWMSAITPVNIKNYRFK